MNNEKSTKEYWDKRVLESEGDPMSLVYVSSGFARNQELSELLIRQFVKKGDRVLDVGCGYGRFFPAFRNVGADYTGIDFSEEMIKLAKETYPDGNFLCMDIKTAAFDHEYDIVFECICASSFGDLAEVMGQKLSNLTVMGGKTIIIEPDIISVLSKGGNLFL